MIASRHTAIPKMTQTNGDTFKGLSRGSDYVPTMLKVNFCCSYARSTAIAALGAVLFKEFQRHLACDTKRAIKLCLLTRPLETNVAAAFA